MKILYVTLGLPYPPMAGAQVRDYELYRRIADRHDVQVFALTESEPPAAHVKWLEQTVQRVYPLVVPTALSFGLLSRLPAHVRFGRPLATLPFVHQQAFQTLNTVVRNWEPDIVQVEHSFLAPYVEAIPANTSCRKVLSLHNIGEVQYERMRQIAESMPSRAAGYIKEWTMREWEARWSSRFDRIITVSAEDRNRLLAHDPSLLIHVIPNGVDTKVLTPLPPSQGQSLLFVGNMVYPPNADAVHYFCDAIFPLVRRELPDATFTAVGASPPPSVQALNHQPGVTIAASVPEVLPYYERAAACVVPLRAGGGTRLKILEAMAFGRPIISTSVGKEGIDVQDGEHLLLADDPQAFAQAIIRVLRQPEDSHRLTQEARARVEERYDWGGLASLLNDLYLERGS